MRKTILILIAMFGVILVKANDSTQFKTNHYGPIPYYTPFTTMFYVKDATVKENWRLAFAMIIGQSDSIYFKTLQTSGMCRSKNCARVWSINVYEKNHPMDKKEGENLEKWLYDREMELRRETIVYNGTPYQLCTFVMHFKNDNGDYYNNPMEQPFKLILGEHPHKSIPKDGIVEHQGGAIHWPTGS